MQNRIDEILWDQIFKNVSYFTLGTSEFWVLGHGYIFAAKRLVCFCRGKMGTFLPRKDGYLFTVKRLVPKWFSLGFPWMVGWVRRFEAEPPNLFFLQSGSNLSTAMRGV